ncbi:hypothetical protein M441DRAFT_307422 [Trichoderma asperellum CBS 433.97]|uniref:Uncharacterized protein n=1 Tax=Trichoderma asperellum (strain ATCC 204424 / CBS 433.97 / NBRC 101777) TaxID=1042311 RepID=A0A2T3ZK00_TRIA4|nr:hypothetical protein M441DRAFT_307422 [Trichoderma asperellum CBS 433.97]PTB45138.1 hypothetical protein M441DRAFT_307422 [Trichoderma asperellum CBS 433.97]
MESTPRSLTVIATISSNRNLPSSTGFVGQLISPCPCLRIAQTALTYCGIPRPNPLFSNLTAFCHEAIRGNLFLMIAICAQIIAARAVWRKRDKRNKTRACIYDAHIQTQTWRLSLD